MGSTLRSLVLRYKADLKDFQKGNRRVIDDIKSSKREIVSLDKEMKKAFTPKVDAARAQIKRLNEQFRAGKMDVQKYGTAVDTLKQKIAAMNRVSAITSHEVGALRGRRVAGANANKALGGAFSGTPGGMSIGQMMASAPERSGVGGAAAQQAGAGGSSFFGTAAGKATGIMFGGLALKKVIKGTLDRVNDVAGGAESDILKGDQVFAAKLGADAFKKTKNDLFDSFGVALGEVANFATGGRAIKDYRGLKEAERVNSMMTAKVDARSPYTEFKEQQQLAKLTKDRSANEVKSMAQRQEQLGNIKLAKDLWTEVVRLEKEAMEYSQSIADARAKAAKDELDSRRRVTEEIDAAISAQGKELQIQRDIDSGMTESQARVKSAGGTAAQQGNARIFDKLMQDLQRRRQPADGNWFDAEGDAAAGIFDRAKADAARVGAFGDQFATPQEVFAKNLKEIQSMLSLGLDPAIAHRAMMQNAGGLAGSEGKLSRFAPSVEVGSRDEMILRENAKAQSKQEKKVNELVDIQKEALEQLKKNGGELKINLTEVHI